MERRNCLKLMFAAGAACALQGAEAGRPVQLEVDLSVDPKREKEFVKNFETIFKPAAVKFPGYIDLKILKLRAALQGKIAAGVNYRFILQYQSEELRQKWVASDVHTKAWPTLENTLLNKDYTVLLYDVAS